VRLLRPAAVVALAAVTALLAGGCGGEAEQAPDKKAEKTATSSTSIEPTKHYTVQQLAAVIGCTPTAGGKAKDFRQAGCENDGDDLVFLDFDTVPGQQDWLNYATLNGGVYLVGNRWVLSGKSKESLQSLRGKLGGTLQEKPRS
jgi:hypothetical protein